MKKNKRRRSINSSSINSRNEKLISLDFTHQSIKENIACMLESSHGHFGDF
jgi:hypothetical protein